MNIADQTTEIFKIKAIVILPISLALLLPMLRFYSNNGVYPSQCYMLTYNRVYSTLVIILLWYFLWQLWDLEQDNRRWYALVLFCSVLLLVASYPGLFGFDKGYWFTGQLFPLALILTVQYVLRSQQKASHLFMENEQLQIEKYKAQLNILIKTHN